jgi:hypothetical protein
VRVQVYFDKSGDGKAKSGAPKLLVLARSSTVADVLETFRGKFKATATTPGGKKAFKYNAIRVVSTGELLHAFTLLDLDDDEALALFSSAQDADVHAAMTRAAEEAAVAGSATNAGAAKDAGAAASADVGAPEPASPAPSTPTAAEKVGEPTTPSYWTPPPPAESRYRTTAVDPFRALDQATQASNAAIRAELTALYKAPSYAPIREQRKALPIYNKRADLLAQIAHHQVTVVSGETGSGKTTQLPLYLLEEMIKADRASECNIVCTQPRRIAAVSVAERVHYESAQPGADTVSFSDLIVLQLAHLCSNRTTF